METEIEVVTDVPAITPRKARVGQILRWAARLTSLPILILILISLIPALMSYSVSARDDRIMTVGLCGACAGLVLAFKWEGLGGLLMLLGVGLMLSQGESLLYPDPFSVAFGLQGLLFLSSSFIHAPSTPADPTPGLGWTRKAALGALAIAAVLGAAAIVRGPGPTAIPHDKQSCIGIWKDGKGFTLEITPDGHAKVSQEKNSKQNPALSPVAPGQTATFLANFAGDDRLELSGTALSARKTYHIDKYPPAGSKPGGRMVLNGSEPYNRAAGVALVNQAH